MGGDKKILYLVKKFVQVFLYDVTEKPEQTFQLIQDGSDGKASVYNAGDLGSSPGLGRSPGKGNGNPLQYDCLENPMDRGAWQAIVYGVAKTRTWLNDFTFTFFHFKIS